VKRDIEQDDERVQCIVDARHEPEVGIDDELVDARPVELLREHAAGVGDDVLGRAVFV
jgi:hypothetical protein